ELSKSGLRPTEKEAKRLKPKSAAGGCSRTPGRWPLLQGSKSNDDSNHEPARPQVPQTAARHPRHGALAAAVRLAQPGTPPRRRRRVGDFGQALPSAAL